MTVPGSLRGRLLVATPPLADPNFDRSVVLVLEHSGDGALGIVLNRPSEHRVAEVVPAWADVVGEPGVVFVGGPVEPGAVIGLAEGASDEASEGWAPVLGSLGTVDLGRDPDDVPGPLHAVRLFAGYAGWAAGQLEAEIDANAWLPVAVRAGDAFGPDAARLWRHVLARQPGRTAWLANFPDDPTTN